MKIVWSLVIALLFCSCGVSGHYADAGPCKGFHTDPQACEQAAANSKVIGRVAMGQTQNEVLAIMSHPAERIAADDSGTTWYYITDYSAELMTGITFVNGHVAKISTAPWK